MRRRQIIKADGSPWIDGDLYMHVGANTMVIKAGSRQRALPCIICRTPAGSQRCHLVVIVAGILCPNDASHLNAAGLFCHARCLPAREPDMARAVAEALKAMTH